MSSGAAQIHFLLAGSKWETFIAATDQLRDPECRLGCNDLRVFFSVGENKTPILHQSVVFWVIFLFFVRKREAGATWKGRKVPNNGPRKVLNIKSNPSLICHFEISFSFISRPLLARCLVDGFLKKECGLSFEKINGILAVNLWHH